MAPPTDGQMEFAIAGKQKIANPLTRRLGSLNTKTIFF